MKTNRILTLATIACAALLAPASLRADDNTGDIVEIRAVDRPGEMTFGSRSAADFFRCTADHPLRAGDEVFFRVRMLVRNYATVPKPIGEAPQEWTFKPGTLGIGSTKPELDLYSPKLGIAIGDRVDGAVYSSYGPEPWMKSGTLKTDDKGVASDQWTYYTDLYFVYTVKPGDLGLPIRLANPTGTGPYDPSDPTADYYLENCSKDGNGAHWYLADTLDNPANFHYYPESLPTKVGWPTGTTRVMQTDLAEEGVFMKTVDFDRTNWQGEDWSAGEIWREVYAGLGPDFLPTLTIEGGARAGATAVYIWSTNETVVVPVASGKNTIIPTEIEGKTYNVLRVPIPAGDADSVSFSIKGADTAVEGDEADLFMSPTQGAVYKKTGELAGVTVTRRIRVGKPKPPTVRLYIDAQGTVTKTVEATPDYVTCETKLMLYMQPICPEDVEVELKGLVNGDDTMGSLREIWEANVLRLADGDFGGDPSTKEFPAGGKYIVKIPGGTSVVPINLYTLGATSKTQKPGVTFSLEKDSGPDSVVVPDSNCTLMITRKTTKPVIVSSEPEFKEGENEGRIEIGSGSKVEFVLDIQDTYKNLNDAGWTFTLKTEGEDFTDPFDLEFNEEDGLFHGVEVEFSAISEGKELTLLVTAPNGTKSAVVKYWLVVTEGKYTTLRRYGDDRIVFCEGESTYVKLGLTQSYSDTGYIFLDADDPEQLKVVDSPVTKEGALITRGTTEVAAERVIRFLDGSKDLSLKAVLCTSPTDKTKTVGSFGSGTIEYSVTNKPPKVASVTAAGQYVSPDMAGKTLADPISRGVKKMFSAVIDDVDADLYAQGAQAMQIKWVIDGETIVTNAIEAATSNAVQVAYTFNNEKDNALVQLFVKDKDMSGFPNAPTFFFYVKVKDTPRVEISTSSPTDTFLETDKSVSSIILTLTEPATEDITVRFRVQQVSDGGFLRIRLVDDGSVKAATGADGKVIPGEYDVIFTRGSVSKRLIVADMDGTNDTLGGLDLNAVVTTTNEYQGVSWSNYYTRAESKLLQVQNVEPEILRPTEAEAAYTNENASANVAYKIYYGASDVSNDLHSAWTSDDGLSVSGVVVRITIDGTAKFTTNVTSTAVGFYEAKFEGEGSHVVEVSYTDKDGMTSRRTVNFFVKPSKRLQLRAHGPAGALGTTGGYSMHYGAASGLGAGRVYAGKQGPQSVSGFVHSYSFGENETAVNAYAFGYKADGKADDGNLLPKPDQAIDENGDFDGASTPVDCYNYSTDHKYGLRGYDSFLYGWACNNTEASNSQTQNAGGGTTTTTPSFLLNIGASGETLIPLPSADNNNNNNNNNGKATSYPVQYWEAVFSREWLKTDNCGDINQDGVPDITVFNFGMGIVDGTGKLISGGSAEGEANSEGDLTDLKGWNKDVGKDGADDPDYLPATETAFYTSFIPGLKESWVDGGVEFGAKLEIRGYGDGLNDALEQLGVTDIESDRIYEDPDLSPTSTLSKVEFLAWSEYKAAHPDKTEEDWSPERPTKPTKSDTDGDGFTDGYEYYFWYKAHVGYMENGVHKYLTGRIYDPRNPGEGRLIPSAVLARLMDPRSDLEPVDFPETSEDMALLSELLAQDAKTRDSDNDGLPDLIEFEIGTNPFDFDTDGDGLPDGFEIIVAGTNPLMYGSSADATADGERNYDGDAMAISSYALEKTQKPVALDIEHAKFTTFAVIDPSDPTFGDTDGVQWYAVKGAPEDVLLTPATNGAAGWSFKLDVAGDTRDYVWYGEKLPVTADGKRLAVTLEKGRGASGAYISSTPVPVVTNGVEEVANPENPGEMIAKNVLITNKLAGALYPVRLAAGTPIKSVLEKPVDIEVLSLASNIEAKVAFACWIYGKGPKNALYGEVAETAADYGCLALGRPLAAAQGAQVVALPGDTRDVAFLHYLVYQEFGFDPRTAWCAKDPVHPRWGKTTSDGQASEGVTVLKQGGYAGSPARTREYRAYDEFLVYSFFLNNGCDMTGFTTADTEAPYLGQVWMAFCTNPRGPNEPEWVNDEHYTGWTAMSLNGTNGADTDGDGVPDGWELYIMAGPKNKNGSYVFAPPYAGFAGSLSGEAGKLEKSYFSPFMKFAKEQQTNNQIYLGGQPNDDGLNEYREFEGTDSTGWYANAQDGNAEPFSTTIVHDGEWTWFNKFFPTDPWNFDTDGDGLSDSAEKGAFAYGTPADDGKLWSIPGGGLNPCSVDTDLDGLPDPWESQFKGKTIYADDAEPKPFRVTVDGAEAGNPLEGLTDGMDGTVPDAYNVVNGDASLESSGSTTWTVIESDGRRWSGHVDRDYDHDGLENWQEYLVGTMRCWRYDDPVSPWTAFDESVYFDEDGDFDPVRSADMLGIGGGDDDEKAAAFWYETLVNVTGPFYNPHFITGMSPAAQYFTRVKNPWDTAYLDAELSGGKVDGAYYYLKDKVGGQKIEDTWAKVLPLPDGSLAAPSKYISCSPVDWDTDCDGMDDYYELFHGLNPILGASGVKADSGNACDIVYDAWCSTSALEAYGSGETRNYWQRNPWKAARGANGMDFEVFPYLAGLQDADPDGDDIRNNAEFLQTRMKDIGSHTDPTPLWMTDSSYSNSLTRLHYRVPMRTKGISLRGAEEFTHNDVTYRFTDFDGFGPVGLGTGFMPFNLDAFWGVAANDEPNWMFSFEENEGFDTDHDALGDREEREALYRAATDPLDADSPRRRQAMYFPGANAALQTMPEVREEYPVATKTWPTDPSFLNFTVECWAKPEDLTRDQTVVERAIWTDPSNPGDQEYLRRNFQIALRGGKWMAKYDSGTLTNDEVKAFSAAPAEAKWTHLAATFDGSEFRLYVDGVCQNGNTCGVRTLPENGVSAYAFVKGTAEGSTKRAGDYAWDVKYECKAILVGASFKGYAEGGRPEALDVTSALGWNFYRDFFKGYVDEIRIWDGARTVDEIRADLGRRYTAEDALENRKAFYKQWANGEDRYAKATTVRVVPELRYHFHFDSVPGAANADSVMKAPTGFQNAGGKPVLSRPVGYAIDWFASVAGGYGTVYGPDCDWIQWIPNTVAHLPRYDGTTLDSFFWSEDYTGKGADANRFERSAEPVSRWTQMAYNGAERSSRYKTTPMRHHLVYEIQYASSNVTSAVSLYRFSGRHLNQTGDDLLPLGGAFVKYAQDLWDGQGPSTQWEHTGVDSAASMLPDWYAEYVRRTYGLEGEIDPDTDVFAFGRLMKVRELYLRDLARGIVLTADGMSGEFDPARVQIADSYVSGVPDWWMEFYRIGGESGLDDHDNDGLPNYVEYLLSDVFDFEVLFDPTVADSVQPGIPDYFYRPEGCQLYVGEIFTDHDRMYDIWEDQYPVSQLSRLAFDAYADPDGDGWANVSEMLAGTDPTRTRSLGVEDQVLAEYPVPMIRTRVKIPDHLPESTPIVVQAFSRSIDDKPDAIWRTGASEGSLAKEKVVGLNPGVVRHYYLNPGSITPASFRLEFKDPTFKHLTETKVNGRVTETSTINGNTDEAFWQQRVNDLAHEDGKSGDLVNTANGEKVGWIDYVTGEVEIDFSKLQDNIRVIMDTQTSSSGSSAGGAQVAQTVTTTLYHLIDMSVSYAKLSWSAKLVKQGAKSDLYLSDADEGYVREGKNAFIAWADIDGSGTWQPGEPYGIVRDVDVSWSGTTAELELTDLSPVTPRIMLAGSSEGGKETETKKEDGEGMEGDPDELDSASDRGRTLSSIIAKLRQNLEYEYSGRTTTAAYSNALARLEWIDNNRIETTSFAADEFREQRLRVVRWLINGVPAYRAGSNMRTVLDKKIRTDLKTSLTEADFLVGNENVFDLDWNDLYTEVINNAGVLSSVGNVTELSYLVVFGDGPADWSLISTNNYAVKALNTVIVRKFGKTPVKPVAIAPGAAKEETVHSANPTFKWTMDCPEDEGYTAFNVQVLDGTTVIYDSDKQLVPPRNAEGQYIWEAPLYVGDKTLKGEVFENKKVYTWKVAMYNAKFSNAANYSNAGKFLMEVQTNGYKYGSANVAVRYFGPKSSYEKNGSVIRVRAYTSPDFTGIPVAAGYVATPDSVTDTTVTNANCTVIGIPEGTYYLQAFIDSNGNGVCDKWETQGYLCPRSEKEPIAEYLDPTAITFDSKIGKGDLALIYLEDADTDGDGLPDAWEWATASEAARANGTFLNEKGVDLLVETKAGEFVINKDYSDALALQENAHVPTAGLAGQVRNMLMKLSSPAGVSAATGIDPADIEVTDGGLEVKSEVDPETLTITGFDIDAANKRVLLKVGAETTANVDAAVARFLNVRVQKGAEVTVKVEHAKSPAGPWEVLDGVGGTVTVDRAGTDIEVNLDGELPAQGYFRAKVEEK